jgi:hypothetical protein
MREPRWFGGLSGANGGQKCNAQTPGLAADADAQRIASDDPRLKEK